MSKTIQKIVATIIIGGITAFMVLWMLPGLLPTRYHYEGQGDFTVDQVNWMSDNTDRAKLDIMETKSDGLLVVQYDFSSPSREDVTQELALESTSKENTLGKSLLEMTIAFVGFMLIISLWDRIEKEDQNNDKGTENRGHRLGDTGS